jgi:SNF2 family DNA or RNA helicase
MADLMITQLDEGDVTYATNPLARLTRLTQFASAYATLEGDDLRLAEPSCKIDGLLDVLSEAEGEQVVVFAESRQLIELASARLEKEKISHGLITGAILPAERQNNVDSFQAGRLRVMLCTMGAGGEGITLTAARIVVFLQRSWSLVKNKQAEDRVHRPGQDANKVEIIDVVSVGTVDEEIIDVRELKEERLQEVVRDKEAVRKMLERR